MKKMQHPDNPKGAKFVVEADEDYEAILRSQGWLAVDEAEPKQ